MHDDELETAHAMLHYGRQSMAAAPPEHLLALTVMKLKIIRAATGIGETGVQLHGGIAMTTESRTERLFVRLTQARTMFGDSRRCLNQLLAADASPALS